ncbi:hypothetical protein [Spirosoma arcticum]
MLTTLYRLLVLPFFVRNAGTFAVGFYFAFGFMRPMDHEALITAALGSPFLLGLFGLVWVLYAVRTVGFVRGQLAAPENLFLQTFRLIPTQLRRMLWGILFIQLLSPVILYAGWMGARAVHYQTWGPLVVIVLAVLGLIIAGVQAADYRLRHHAPDAIRLPRLRFRLPYPLFFPTYWLRHEPLSLLLTKLLSGGLLVGVCRLYPTDDYDQRLLLIGLMLAVITHSQVGRQFSAFEQRYLLLLPNLPLSVGQRFGRYALIYGLIWLPELLILLRNCPSEIQFAYVGSLWLTGWGWLLLLHGLAYGRDVSPDRWQTAVFWGFIIGLLSIMFGLPLVVWGAVGWLGSIGVAVKRKAPCL